MNFIYRLLTLAIAVTPFVLSAEVAAPKITGLHALYSRMSDNGKWAVSEKGSEVDGTIEPAGGYLLNLETMENRDLSPADGFAGVSDVTDDGQIVVGSFQTRPAMWTPDEGWIQLPIPPGCQAGYLSAVTPDGKYAVGYAVPIQNSAYARRAICYDLTKRDYLELSNLPELDMLHENMDQTRFTDISADGRYIIGEMSFSYVMPPQQCAFVYDREAEDYEMLGFIDYDDKDWEPLVKNLNHVENPTISPNGEWIVGGAYMAEPVPGSNFPKEYSVVFRYNLKTKNFEIFNGEDDSDYFASLILNDGTVIAGSPASTPYRYAHVRCGNYYIALADIFKQVYGIDFEAVTGDVNTGTPWTATTDGRTFIFAPSPNDSYLLKLDEYILDAAKRVDMLADYTVSPVSGSVMGRLSTVTLNFTRKVETNGSSTQIKCTKSDGSDTGWKVSTWKADGRKITLGYMPRELAAGETYTITIPAGRIRMAGDAEITSPEIAIKFTGREPGSVKLVAASPADGNSVAGLSLETNPILLEFNAEIQVVENAVGQLWRKGESAPFCGLAMLNGKNADNGNQLLVYPLTDQHLYSGTDYQVVIPAGSVTDISGAGANEEIVLNYKGSYVRQISSDDKYLFRSTCDSYDEFIFYEGDHLVPADGPASWGFTKDNPWLIVRSSDTSTDMAIAAHSMFATGGTSDDWMVIPQLLIPDKDCYLTFDAQSYSFLATDNLKVYVYESKNVYNTLNKTIIDDIRANGDLIYDEVLSPGEDEEGLEGDWDNITLQLDKYAGKEVYIAFVNNNTDASAIFLDNIQVIRDLSFLTTFVNSDRVVAKNGIIISGNIAISSEIDTYNSISLTLRDADDTVIEVIGEDNITLAKGDVYPFSFTKELPLTIGERNKYSVIVKLDNEESTIAGAISSLSFEPVKKIVVEEFSGRDCPNCPLGLVAMENLERTYPGRVIPVLIRTYGSDPHGTGMASYTSFLGLSAAPTARINRGGIESPMVAANGKYLFSGAGYVDSNTGQPITTWYDIAVQEMSKPADADINFTSVYDKANNRANVSATVRSALNLENTPINIFAVLLEDKLETYQQNNLSSSEDENLGEWGKGGIYGSPYVFGYIINDVARSTYGITYNGTGNLIPSTLNSGEEYPVTVSVGIPETVAVPENCKVVLMLIDPGTGSVINANVCAINGNTSGVEDAVIDEAGAPVVSVADGVITAVANGAVSVNVYAVDGTLLGSAAANGAAAVELGGYNGVVIVKASANGVAVAEKVVVK
ncbi:MAG: Omp28-related outer membrane protein [Muribaculaceae bacterium]|jgi:hypothetical protein|nr:Omp28-related outer membrane protein [Muribaculaceae bacterium]